MLVRKFLFRFSSKSPVPVVDVTKYINSPLLAANESACKEVASAFHKYGALIIKDPRVKREYNEEFLDMMEGYFYSRAQKYYAGKPVEDIFPQYGFQTGATPEYKELAKPHPDLINCCQGENKPDTPGTPPYDAKWRYFWRIGERPPGDRTLDPPRYIPKDVPKFEFNMNRWGELMINAVFTVSEMLALGYKMPRNTFTELLKGGPHLLAPTGSDLDKYKKGTIFAALHYDFNFLTIHGKSRFPGLFVWLRTGEKVSVAVPEGCLLLQAGKQLEILTGGEVTNGFHEVIYTDEVLKACEKAKSEKRIPWRVSSTLFSHIRYDVDLEPLGQFATEERKKKYPAEKAYKFVERELKDIKLMQ